MNAIPLTQRENEILVIACQEGGARLAVMASVLGLSASMISRHANSLVRRRLLMRRFRADDLRHLSFIPTVKGRAVALEFQGTSAFRFKEELV